MATQLAAAQEVVEALRLSVAADPRLRELTLAGRDAPAGSMSPVRFCSVTAFWVSFYVYPGGEARNGSCAEVAGRPIGVGLIIGPDVASSP